MPSWIDLIQKETDAAETPRSYIYWAGLSAISAVIAPNVWLNRGGVYLLRPNLYVLLIGHSGLGKGLPIAIAKRLATKVGSSRVISGRNSIQAIIKGLSEPHTNTVANKQVMDARGFIVSGEFATLLLQDDQALTILTDLYDTHYNEVWKNTLKNSPVEELKSPCITMFGGSSPEHFAAAVPSVNIGGGFMGRTLVVYEENRHRINPLSNTDDAVKINIDYLAEHLHEVAKCKGGFKFSDEAVGRWEEWYIDFRKKKFEDETGLTHRMPDHVLKVAMCISLTKKFEMIITEEDLEESISACMLLGLNTKRITKGSGKSTLGPIIKKVFEMLVNSAKKQMTRQELLLSGYGNFASFELDHVVRTLEEANLVIATPAKDTIIYSLTTKAMDDWNNYYTEAKKGVH